MYSYPDKDVMAMSEQDLLEAINRLDVKQESKLIHRIVYISRTDILINTQGDEGPCWLAGVFW